MPFSLAIGPDRLRDEACEYGRMADVTVRRVDFGYFVRPAEETGTGDIPSKPMLTDRSALPIAMVPAALSRHYPTAYPARCANTASATCFEVG